MRAAGTASLSSNDIACWKINSADSAQKGRALTGASLLHHQSSERPLSATMAMASAPETWAATLGMFIIDIFRFEDPQTGQDLGDRGLGDQIGGGGTYFAIGARVW